jgi:hypothetical protein
MRDRLPATNAALASAYRSFVSRRKLARTPNLSGRFTIGCDGLSDRVGMIGIFSGANTDTASAKALT